MKLYSRIIGKGKPLVILHGLFGMSDNWLTIGRRIAEHGFCVHLPDLRNHGRSPHAETHRYPDMCEDLLSYFDQHNLENAGIIGHSMGGKLAMVFGLLEPERITRLIIVDIAPSAYTSAQSSFHRTIIRALQQTDPAAHTSRGAIRKELTGRLGDPALALFLSKSIGRQQASGSFFWKFNLPVLEKFLDHIHIGFEELSIYAPCPVKTLFIKGNHSSYYLEEHEPDRQFFFPDSSVTGIDNAGHWLHSDQPEQFIVHALRFLG
jgi:esterase